MIKGKYGWEEDPYTIIKRNLSMCLKVQSMTKDIIDNCDITFDELRSFSLGMSEPNYHQAKLLAKVIKMPLIEEYFIPEHLRLSAIDMNTGESIKIEEC